MFSFITKRVGNSVNTVSDEQQFYPTPHSNILNNEVHSSSVTNPGRVALSNAPGRKFHEGATALRRAASQARTRHKPVVPRAAPRRAAPHCHTVPTHRCIL